MADDAPATPALDAWYETHTRSGSDTADIILRHPHRAPEMHVHTAFGGCDDPPRLPDPEHPTMTLRLGPIAIVGFIDEMERYAAAITDVVAHARWQVAELTDDEGVA